MKKLNIALLSGGISSEREVSLNSGDQVFEALDKEKYNVTRYDPKTDLARLVENAAGIDAAVIILHGLYGEDGTIQGLLDLLDIPYQGSGVLGSSLAMNKLASKQLYKRADIPSPAYLVAGPDDGKNGDLWIEQLGLPLVIKPVEGGSSIGITIVKTREELAGATRAAFEQDSTILIEQYIDGIELTGGVVGNQNLEAFPIIEIVPDEKYEYFDYTAKYTAGATREICPARIDDELTRKAQSYAKMSHKALFCRGYSRTDMILKGDDIYVLETNTIPGMTATSLLPQAAAAAGTSFTRLMDQLIELSLEERRPGRMEEG